MPRMSCVLLVWAVPGACPPLWSAGGRSAVSPTPAPCLPFNPPPARLPLPTRGSSLTLLPRSGRRDTVCWTTRAWSRAGAPKPTGTPRGRPGNEAVPAYGVRLRVASPWPPERSSGSPRPSAVPSSHGDKDPGPRVPTSSSTPASISPLRVRQSSRLRSLAQTWTLGVPRTLAAEAEAGVFAGSTSPGQPQLRARPLLSTTPGPAAALTGGCVCTGMNM